MATHLQTVQFDCVCVCVQLNENVNENPSGFGVFFSIELLSNSQLLFSNTVLHNKDLRKF